MVFVRSYIPLLLIYLVCVCIICVDFIHMCMQVYLIQLLGCPQLMFVVQLLSTKDTTLLPLPSYLSTTYLQLGCGLKDEYSKGLSKL